MRLSGRHLPIRDLNHRVLQCGPNGGLEDFLSQIRRILPPAGQHGQQHRQESQQQEVLEDEGVGPSGSRVLTAPQRRADAVLTRGKAALADRPSSSSESEEMWTD